jgi:hypothetical protein
MTRTIRASVAIGLAVLLSGSAIVTVQAADRGKARTSVNSKNTNVNRNSNKNVNVNSNRNVNRNTNVDIDRHRDVDIDIDVDHRHGGCCYHPVATAAAVTATAVVTAAVVGSVVHTLPPACSVVIVNGFTYQQCGTVWYQPQFVGTTTTYVVINAPR